MYKTIDNYNTRLISFLLTSCRKDTITDQHQLKIINVYTFSLFKTN